MIRRNITTAFIAITSAALLYGGITFARGPQSRDDSMSQVVATVAPTFEDDAGPRGLEQPEPSESAEPDETFDDHGGNGADDASASPDETFDDHGGNGDDDATVGPTESADDNGSGGHGADDTPSPSASPDDNGGGGNGADDTPSPSASPDDNGGHGSDG